MSKTKTNKTALLSQDGDELDIDVVSPSKFLKKEDCDPPIAVTMDYVDTGEVMGKNGPETKWILHFEEDVKPLVLGKEKCQSIAAAVGTRNMRLWSGRKIVLFWDRTVRNPFGGTPGGIRARKYVPRPSQRPHRPVSLDEANSELSAASSGAVPSQRVPLSRSHAALTEEEEAEIDALTR
jgi:hypothetical protein